MAVKDIDSLRPAYMNWTLFRDYHYAVYNKDGERCLTLVTLVDSKRSFFVKDEFIDHGHRIVYVDDSEQARLNLGLYARDCNDLIETLRYEKFPEGQYGMSVVDASGKRLYTFELFI